MAKPTFEGLPTELHILILFQIPDRASLKSIVFSSSICHQAYLTVRQEVLCHILKNQYGVLLGEAIAAIRSRGLYFESCKEEAIALLDIWRRRKEISELALTLPNRIDEPGNLEEILNLFHFDKVLQFFLEDYAMRAPRPAWIERDQWENSMTPFELSHTEKHRSLRALCRLQTHANIFARPEAPKESHKPRYYNAWDKKEIPVPYVSTYEEAYRLFFGAMSPWEYEEMGCVWAYLKTKYSPSVYMEISDGLHDLMEKYGPKESWQRDSFEFLPRNLQPPLRVIESIRGLELLPDCTGSLAAIGPEFLYRLLHATPLRRRDMVLANADWMEDTFIGNGSRMFVRKDEMLPLIYPADRHAVRDFEQFWSTLPSIERPNLGWKMVHMMPHTPYENFEDTLDLEGKRECGWDWSHAIWDDERLKRWRAPILEEHQDHQPSTAPLLLLPAQ